MTAKRTAKVTNITSESTNSDNVIMVTKASWYKEASGIIAVLGWSLLMFLWTYSIVSDGILDQWYYVLAIATVAVVASAYRQGSTKIEIERTTL